MQIIASPLKDAVEGAIGRPDLLAEVDRMYANIRAETETRRPRCEMSGRCCNFEAYGHRMFVSTIELAAFVAGLRATSMAPPILDRTSCPFQVGKACSVHSIRPMGCRVFFCDPSAGEWQNNLYERTHQQFRLLHEAFDVPYFYVEWREALTELGLVDRSLGAGVDNSSSQSKFTILQ